jgi:hypothetical protein
VPPARRRVAFFLECIEDRRYLRAPFVELVRETLADCEAIELRFGSAGGFVWLRMWQFWNRAGLARSEG